MTGASAVNNCTTIGDIEFYGQLTDTTVAGTAPFNGTAGLNGLFAARRASGQPVAATANESAAGAGPERMVDGDVGTHWFNGSCPGGSWFRVDAGAGRSFTPHAVTIKPHPSDAGYAISWEVEGSNDASTWQALSSHSNDHNMRRRGDMWNTSWLNGDGTASFRYLRWRMTGNGGYGSCVVLMEIEFYGSMS